MSRHLTTTLDSAKVAETIGAGVFVILGEGDGKRVTMDERESSELLQAAVMTAKKLNIKRNFMTFPTMTEIVIH